MNETISSKQLALFILTAQLGFGMISFPAHLVAETGHDGWIALLITGLLASVVIVPIMLLLRRYQDHSIYQINKRLFGSSIGRIFNFLLLCYLLFLTTVAIRLFTEYICLFQLEQIPRFIASLLIVAPTVYLTRYGLKPVVRFSAFVVVILAVFYLSAWIVKNNIRISFLEPVGAAGWQPLLKNMPLAFMTYIGFELVTFVYPAVTDRRHALKWVVIANLASTFVLVSVFIVTTGLFGEELLKRFVSPLFSLSRYIKIPPVERIDLFSFLFWFPLAESTFRAYFYTAYHSFRTIFQIENQTWVLLIFIGALVLLSGIPTDLNQVLQLLKWVNYAGMTVTIFFIVCYGFSFLRRGVTKNG